MVSSARTGKLHLVWAVLWPQTDDLDYKRFPWADVDQSICSQSACSHGQRTSKKRPHRSRAARRKKHMRATSGPPSARILATSVGVTRKTLVKNKEGDQVGGTMIKENQPKERDSIRTHIREGSTLCSGWAQDTKAKTGFGHPFPETQSCTQMNTGGGHSGLSLPPPLKETCSMVPQMKMRQP